VRKRVGYLALAAVLGVGVAVLPALAASETTPAVEAVNHPATLYTEEKHSWSPPQTTVIAGGAVTFSNPSTIPHGVEWVGGPAKPGCTSGVPVGTTEAASGTKWSGTCTFAQAGTYTFYCTVHHAEMTGTIVVNADETTTTTTTTPTTTTPTTESPSGSPLARPPLLRAKQGGGIVKGSLDISQAGAGSRLEIGVFAQSASLVAAKRPTRTRVGHFVRGSVPAGVLPFSVKLTAKARKAVKRHRRLLLSVSIKLTTPNGKTVTVPRSVTEHA
jgi:plastocyanin